MVDEVAQTRTKMRNEENPDRQMMRFIIFSEKRLKLVEITQYPYNGAIGQMQRETTTVKKRSVRGVKMILHPLCFL